MRLALFGSGGAMPETVLRALASRHEVRALVHPDPQAGSLRSHLRALIRAVGLRPEDPLLRAARELHVSLVPCRSGGDGDVADVLRRLDLDLIVIAAFPFVLAPEIFQRANKGAVNIHTSLLPRHRGPLPLFWVYHADDRETGVTLHEVTAKADAGKVWSQIRFPLERGLPIHELHDRCCREGAQMLLSALAVLDEKRAGAWSQDERLATPAPRVQPGVSMVDFAAWPVERVWHFLHGMYPHFVEPLRDLHGELVEYGGVLDFAEDPHSHTLGVVERGPDKHRLFCRDGFVTLAAKGTPS